MRTCKPCRVSALLTRPLRRTLPASSRASLACLTLAVCAVCVLPTYNMRTCRAVWLRRAPCCSGSRCGSSACCSVLWRAPCPRAAWPPARQCRISARPPAGPTPQETRAALSHKDNGRRAARSDALLTAVPRGVVWGERAGPGAHHGPRPRRRKETRGIGRDPFSNCARDSPCPSCNVPL